VLFHIEEIILVELIFCNKWNKYFLNKEQIVIHLGTKVCGTSFLKQEEQILFSETRNKVLLIPEFFL
jgi:hypothetical protein